MKTAFITGVTGQDGAYLSRLLLEKGYRVIGLTRSYNSSNTSKLAYLGIADKVIIEECDLLDMSNIIRYIIKYEPCEIYNLAAQSSVRLSFEQPLGTVNFNVMSVINILEAIKNVGFSIKFYQASSSEMFGNVQDLPVSETTAFHPVSPYAVSKATGHWLVVNYRESYKLFACCGILFNHESFLRPKSFFVKKVIAESLQIKSGAKDFIRLGNIDVKRDFGYSPEYVKAMWLMMQVERASYYIICSGRSISLRDIVYHVFDRLGLDRSRVLADSIAPRPNDICDLYGDNAKARIELGWDYSMSFESVLDLLIEEERLAINENSN